MLERFPTGRGECTVAVTERLDALPGALRDRGVVRAVLVSDANVEARWGARARELVPVGGTLVIPPGERHKTLATWEGVVDGLLRAGVDRGTAVVALGGGMVGDVAGFAAAVTLRGLEVVQVPTTLLAMVDAAVGGKTAVDHPLGKNLVGAFHPPLHVHAALETLGTLPEDELVAGLGEVVKTALILDAELFHALERGPVPVRAMVERCVRAKVSVVVADEREEAGRVVLNAGHTVAHALERVLGFGALAHGRAVMIGLVAEAEHAVRAGVCEDPELPSRLRAVGRRLGLPVELPAGADPAALVEAATLDKKGRADTIRLPLPLRVGRTVTVDLPKAELHHLFSPRPTPP